ncbi:hypothetical protein HID58_095271, partial [Brassica napus]
RTLVHTTLLLHSGDPGLGRRQVSYLVTLSTLGVTKNVIVHCLSHNGKGFLSIGDELFPSSGVTWTSLSLKPPRWRRATFFFFLKLMVRLFCLVKLQDWTSSFSLTTRPLWKLLHLLHAEAYQTILDLIRKDLKGKPLKDTKEDKSLPVCWKDMKPLKSVHDVKKTSDDYFTVWESKERSAVSDSTRVISHYHCESHIYLYISIKIHGRESLRLRVLKKETCVGDSKRTEIGLENYNIIGYKPSFVYVITLTTNVDVLWLYISFQGIMVIYDNEKAEDWMDSFRLQWRRLSSEEAYPRGFGLIGELFSGKDGEL